MGDANIVVLVVEDELLIRMNIVDHLQDAGFTVLEAATSDEAVEVLERNSDIQVLFTDIEMPGSMDGLKLAAAVRGRWPPIKIVVTSGVRGVRSEQLPSGAAFMPKPYNHDEVAATLLRIAS